MGSRIIRRCTLMAVAATVAVVLTATAVPAQAQVTKPTAVSAAAPAPGSNPKVGTPGPYVPGLGQAYLAPAPQWIASHPKWAREQYSPVNGHATKECCIICLSHSYDWCQGAKFEGTTPPGAEEGRRAGEDVRGPSGGADGTDVVIQAIDEVSRSALIIGWINILASKSSWVAKVVEVLGRGGDRVYAERVNRQVQGKCFGVWAGFTDISYGSCSSHHGIYWHTQCENSSCTDWRAWDDYTNQELVTGQTLSEWEPTWDSKSSVAGSDWRTWSLYYFNVT